MGDRCKLSVTILETATGVYEQGQGHEPADVSRQSESASVETSTCQFPSRFQ